MSFTDRSDAGRLLAGKLGHWQQGHPIVLGIPRGGVPVASSVAHRLDTDLDVLVARKLIVTHQPGLVLGAVSEDGISVVNHADIQACDLTRDTVDATRRRASAEARDRARAYRRGRPRLSLTGRIVILVDDGVITGTTARAACRSVWRQQPYLVVFAAPVVPARLVRPLLTEATAVVSLTTPVEPGEIASCYEDFQPVTDRQVGNLLEAGLNRWTDQVAT